MFPGADQSITYIQVNLKSGCIYVEQPWACLGIPVLLNVPRKKQGCRRAQRNGPLNLLCTRASDGSDKQ